MKGKEGLQQELTKQRNSNIKSTEIITQLKDAEKKVRELVVSAIYPSFHFPSLHLQSNFEKQISEMKNANQSLIVKNREQQTRMVEQNNTIESLKSQLGELSNVLRNKDSSLAKETASRRDAEIEIDRLHVKLDDAERVLETNKPAESENSQLEALRVCLTSYIQVNPY
jgi:E3 ubiquitin-protein ligase BRE1